MAQPCDAAGRQLKLGDRRWVVFKKQAYELIFVDLAEGVMRFLALPLENVIAPDEPSDAVPVPSEIDPLTPAVPAFGVAIAMSPLDVAVPTPDAMVM